MIVYIFGFLISWLPYFSISLCSTFITSSHISPLISILPSLLAKLSLIWSSSLYLLSNKKIKSKFSFDLLRKNKKDSYEIFNMDVRYTFLFRFLKSFTVICL
jgi:hypothetical protein